MSPPATPAAPGAESVESVESTNRPPLLRLRDATRAFASGDGEIRVLKDIDLTIHAGEMVAIMGASGSGKSTLMNVLGCLDRLTHGIYEIDGRDTRELDSDALARLRRERFGFIFQRYHLMPHLSALSNVEVPAIYAGIARSARLARARHLLALLGLDTHAAHHPSQLSGGQQQRVSIARALMNGGQIILADEPTGALDSRSGRDVMRILHALHALGHTVIIVTHDAQIAGWAERIIEIADGAIVADRPNTPNLDTHAQTIGMPNDAQTTLASDAARVAPRLPRWLAAWPGMLESLAMAWHALASHRLRTALTMLGVIIGITSVVSISAIGEGAKRYVLEDIRAIGTNVISIFPGKDFGDDLAASIRTLAPSDLDMLQAQPYVDSVTPQMSSRLRVRYRRADTDVTVNGVGAAFFRVRGVTLSEGAPFTEQDVLRQAQIVVIDDNTRKKLFGAHETPIGKIILVGTLPCLVAGVTRSRSTMFGSNDSLNLWMPYTTAGSRLLGRQYFSSIAVRIRDGEPTKAVEQNIVKQLTVRHGSKDFFTYNFDSVIQSVDKTSRSLTLFLSLVALISLLVGGIGVMNIMLVSVTERIREIGIRMAVGARQRDIMRQFLIEAVLVCLCGGLVGISLSYGIGALFSLFVHAWKMMISLKTLCLAVTCACGIGIASGWFPARSAARLDPVDALARE